MLTATGMHSRWAVIVLSAVILISCGGGGADSGDAGNGPAPSPTMLVLAGHMGGPGNVNGRGSAARFWLPTGTVSDPAGNLYVADTYNHVIRKVTPEGMVSTVAGVRGYAGADDGPAKRATFYGPGGLAMDRAGNLYIADNGNYTVRRLTPAGSVVTVAGTPGVSGYLDGDGPAARFGPCWTVFGCETPGLAVDSRGNVFYGDSSNGVIRRIAPTGTVTTFAGRWPPEDARDGPGSSASFYQPGPLAIDAADNLYVGDRYALRKVTPSAMVSTLAGQVYEAGFADGTGTAARFFGLTGMAVDGDGNIFATDVGNNAVRRITPDGIVTTAAGQRGGGVADGPAQSARFLAPAGIAIDSAGQLHVADGANNTIRRISALGQVTTLAGLAEQSEPVDGTGANARFGLPVGIVAADDGTIYVADQNGKAIRKVDLDGTTTTVAGQLGVEGIDDGPAREARFKAPYGLARGADGSLYLADALHFAVRKIAPDGRVSTLAGGGQGAAVDGKGKDAIFARPFGLAVDASGHLYVADTEAHTIRKVTRDGTVTTIAGLAHASGTSDGIGAEARFNRPRDVAVDASGNLFVADEFNHTIRKITPAGVVSTMAGSPGEAGSADGLGAEARFYRPGGLTVSPEGAIYVADSWNHTIRKITSAGSVTTVVGKPGVRGFVGDELPGVLSFPQRIALRGQSMYVTTARGVVVVSRRP